MCHEKIAKLLEEGRGDRKKEEKTPEAPRRRAYDNASENCQDPRGYGKRDTPMLQHDGGDVELIDLEGNRVVVALRGLCTSCPSSALTNQELRPNSESWCTPTSTSRRRCRHEDRLFGQ